MSLAASFLGGARSRLLPASVPFRFFACAALYHISAWAVLLTSATDLPTFIGGSGPLLSALHLLTLGVLVMTVVGASFQLLPVATRNPMSRTWPTRLCFWFFAPGTALLAFGMSSGEEWSLITGSGCVGIGLLIFAVLTAGNLHRVQGQSILISHVWTALIALALLTLFGLLLAADFNQGFLADRQTVSMLHMVVAVFGFMGLLVFGFSHILIPMFALSHTLPKTIGWTELTLSVLAIAVALAGLLLQNLTIILIASFIGMGAMAAYFRLMQNALKTRMRKRLGLSFLLIKSSWVFLGFAMLTGMLVLLAVPLPNGDTLFGFLLVVGWLLTFLLGVLQRIMPFLASMHAAGKKGLPPLLSDLTAETPLKIHAACHVSAVLTCSAGIILEEPLVLYIGAGLGLVGSLAFAAFATFVLLQLKRQPLSG